MTIEDFVLECSDFDAAVDEASVPRWEGALPILVRPVREQLEHDRVIRLLHAKWKKKLDAEANVGEERNASLKVGQATVFPDLVLTSSSPPRRVHSIVEVETGESVNNLEAMAQWTHMSRAKAPFWLFVPTGAVDQARRLCAAHRVSLAELWSYYVLGDQVRFTLIHREATSAKGKTPVAGDVFETEILGPLEYPSEAQAVAAEPDVAEVPTDPPAEPEKMRRGAKRVAGTPAASSAVGPRATPGPKPTPAAGKATGGRAAVAKTSPPGRGAAKPGATATRTPARQAGGRAAPGPVKSMAKKSGTPPRKTQAPKAAKKPVVAAKPAAKPNRARKAAAPPKVKVAARAGKAIRRR